jgi:hypothetical protein
VAAVLVVAADVATAADVVGATTAAEVEVVGATTVAEEVGTTTLVEEVPIEEVLTDEVSIAAEVGATAIVDETGATTAALEGVEVWTATVLEVTAEGLALVPKARILSTALSARIMIGAEGLVAT